MARVRKPTAESVPRSLGVPSPDEIDVDARVAELEILVETAASDYAVQDEKEKSAKKSKDVAKKAFLEAATELVALTSPLAKKTVKVTKKDLMHGFGLEEWLAREHRGWRVLEIYEHPTARGGYMVDLEEDPALMKFHVVVDEKVVGRTTAEAAPEFDGEGAFNDLAAEIDQKMADTIINIETVTTYELDEAAAQAWATKEPRLVGILQRHTTPGAITAKMTPVRRATEDD